MDETGPAPVVVDVDEMRAATLAVNCLPGVDVVRTFYCDETNNIRRLCISDAGLNVAEPMCFAIGGVVHAGPARAFDIEGLRKAISAQPSATELKLKHIGSGTALDILASRRLGPFLDWLRSENLLAHWSVLDPVYWSTVDIVDSILVEQAPQLFGLAPALKTDLLLALRRNLPDTIQMFRAYGYPDVPEEKADDFLEDLRRRVFHAPDLAEFNQHMLMDVLKVGRGLGELPFLAGETSGELIESFTDFYLQRFYLFPESHHVMDTEPEIMARLDGIALQRKGQPFKNYRFVDRSHDEPGIQIADIVTGLLGKVFTWVRDTETGDVVAAKAGLGQMAHENLNRLSDLMDRSTDACPALAHHVLSLADAEKVTIFLDA